jgi:NAD(P)-dependent dehydrogenase (short-subunit alcohol dehydrogenase family)
MRRGSLLEITEDDWDACFAVNATAAFRLCRAAILAMSATGGGAIVNIASQWGLQPAAGHVAYNASKAAMVSLTQSIARDHGAEGIRANAVCPGEILTPMVQQKLTDSGTTEEDLARSVPVGRLGRPTDVADLVAFLLSDRAGYMNGAAVEITGGQVVA